MLASRVAASIVRSAPVPPRVELPRTAPTPKRAMMRVMISPSPCWLTRTLNRLQDRRNPQQTDLSVVPKGQDHPFALLSPGEPIGGEVAFHSPAAYEDRQNQLAKEVDGEPAEDPPLPGLIPDPTTGILSLVGACYSWCWRGNSCVDLSLSVSCHGRSNNCIWIRGSGILGGGSGEGWTASPVPRLHPMVSGWSL